MNLQPFRMASILRAGLLLTLLLAALLAAVLFVVTAPFVTPVPSSPEVVDPARLRAHVRHLSVELHPRDADSFENLDRAAEYIHSEFRSVAPPGRIEVQEVISGGRAYKNVIVHFGPSAGEVVVVGAHYDSHAATPGADDNASGVAGLIELAGLLSRYAPSGPVDLVAYALEEPPHFQSDSMGSVQHARSLRKAGREVRLMLALEMIGFFSDEAGSQRYPHPWLAWLYPDRGNFIAVVGRPNDLLATRRVKGLMAGATDLSVQSINAPRSLAGVDWSDHGSFWDEGYNALMITDTAFLRNRNYHLAGDTFDRLDYRRMAEVVRAVHSTVRGVAHPP